MQAPRAQQPAAPWELYLAYGTAVVCFLVAAVLRFWRLDADIDPSVSKSLAFLTDEGWKSANALSKHITGEWLNSQRNHILLLPVMPVLQFLTYEAFGVSLTTTRAPAAVFSLVGLAAAGWWVVRGRTRDRRAVWTLAVFAMLMTTHHPYLVFSRMALVDVPMFSVGLVALHAFYGHRWRGRPWSDPAIVGGLGLAITVMTKTSGVLFFGMLIIAAGIEYLMQLRLPKPELKRVGVAIVVASATVGVVHLATNYWLVGDLQKAPVDNVSRRILFGDEFERHFWLLWTRSLFQNSPLMFWLSLAGALGAIVSAAREGVMPLADRVMLSLYVSLWLFYGYFLYQPARYLVVMAVPMMYFAACVPTHVAPALARFRVVQGALVVFSLVALVFAHRWHGEHLTKYLEKPKYTLRDTAVQIQERVQEDARARGVKRPVLYGEFSPSFSAVTGMPFSLDIWTEKRPIYVVEHHEHAERGRGVTELGHYRVVRKHKKRDVFLYRWDRDRRPPKRPKRIPR